MKLNKIDLRTASILETRTCINSLVDAIEELEKRYKLLSETHSILETRTCINSLVDAIDELEKRYKLLSATQKQPGEGKSLKPKKEVTQSNGKEKGKKQ